MGNALDTALTLASAGLPVFPCRPGTKYPATKHGLKDASVDPDQIKAWWEVNPNYNLAMAVPGNMVVVDFEGNAKKELEDIIGCEFPETKAVSTPGHGGGVHLWYSKPHSVPLTNRVRLMSGMDIRTSGGYVMVPPSTHPDGGTYEWLDTRKVEPAPDWLVQMCLRSKEDSKETDEIMPVTEMLKGIPKGMQRWVMFRYACSRRAKRYDPDEIKMFLWQVASSCEQDPRRPWKKADTDKLVDDVWSRYEAMPEHRAELPGKVWTPDELIDHPFPTDKWIVKPLLQRGVTVVSSHAKRGKSMMVSTLIKSIALGEKVWGQFESQKTGVLCLDLEQDEGAAADRWRHIRGNDQLPNVHIAFTWPRMGSGGLEAIVDFLKRHANIGVVVIDTWAMFNPPGASDASAGLNAYYQEYDVLGQLKGICHEFGVAMIVVHHFAKNTDRPSGTAAFEGAPDGDWRLHREGKSRIAILDVKGKNVPETRIAFDVDLRTYTWNVTSIE